MHPYAIDDTATALVSRASSLAREVLARHAAEVDATPRFPEESLQALAAREA